MATIIDKIEELEKKAHWLNTQAEELRRTMKEEKDFVVNLILKREGLDSMKTQRMTQTQVNAFVAGIESQDQRNRYALVSIYNIYTPLTSIYELSTFMKEGE